eukprot:TRINITY_DN14761_c0_g1_i1.p1 TRINITY_DN14761_c0_g1~~TRINITY_DN14761_c0_g1_i1.p1  ORF type:complete len:637 (-),score=214.27 TRINITY_DN14761_c0_g1_i1:86-1996(-)
MSSYSSLSSDDDDFSEDDKEEEEVWNPTELIDAIRSASTDDERLHLKTLLLEKFLDQNHPFFSSKMQEFFAEKGVTESFLGFVTRLTNEPVVQNDGLTVPVSRPAASQDDPGMHRSFKVMELFIRPQNGFYAMIGNNLSTVLHELFKIAQSNSIGSFAHFNKIMDQLLSRAPTDVTQVLVGENLVWHLLDHVYERSVADTLFACMCPSFSTPHAALHFYKSLVRHKVVERLGERIHGNGQQHALAAADFLIRVIDRLCNFDPAAVFFQHLAESQLIHDLFATALTDNVDVVPPQQLKACAAVLKELILNSAEPARPNTTHHLKQVSAALVTQGRKHIADLCKYFVAAHGNKKESPVQYSSYVVKRPFGLHRFMMLEFFTALVCSDAANVLPTLPVDIWRVLSSWFLEYTHNTLFQAQFYRLFQAALHELHEPTLMTLLKKYRLLTELIRHYREVPFTDARGHIILICNSLRFRADMQAPSGFLRHYLLSHDAWKAFLPILKDETRKHTRRPLECGRPEADEGVELGSEYARRLGFDGLPESEPEPAVAVVTPKTAGCKKKKKKKKKVKSRLSLSADGADDAEDDSGDEEEEGSSSDYSSMSSSGRVDSPALPHTNGVAKEAWVHDLRQQVENVANA